MTDKLKLADPNGNADLDKTMIALELEEHHKRLREMEQNIAALEKLLAEQKRAAAAAQRRAASATNKIGARKDAGFKAISTAPSINLTPRGRGMVPVAYPVVQDLSGSVKAASSVRFNGKPAYLLDQTSQPSCTGDGAGTGGGVRSGTVGGEVKPVAGSRSVRIEGKHVVREGDACTMNGGNNPGIYVTTQAPSGGIKNGKIDGDTDPPIQAQTPEEKSWLSEWWARTKQEMRNVIAHPVEGGKGAVKGTANAAPATGELLTKSIASQRAQELQEAAAIQNLFGQTKAAQQLAEVAQEVQRMGDAIELPKFEMSNAAQRGGDKIVTGVSLLAGGAGIVKTGIKGARAMGKTAARAEGDAARGAAGGGKLAQGEQASAEGAKTAGATAETGKGAKVAAVPEQPIHSTGDGVKILEMRSGQPFVKNPSVGKNSAVAEQSAIREQVLGNIADSQSARTSSGFPIHVARTDQIRWGYGADEWSMKTLPAGSRVYGGIPGQSAYYTTEEALASSAMGRASLFQSLQVTPHPAFGYRPQMGVYEVTSDLSIPSGIVLANQALGPGGATQYFIRNYNSQLRLLNTINLGH